MAMAVPMVGDAQQPRTGNIHPKPDDGDRNRFAKADGNGREEPHNGFVADENGDHRQNDRARESGKVAQLSGTEYEAPVVGVLARVHIGERRNQHGARVCRHVQPVCDQRQGPKDASTDDFDQHHDRTQSDYRPGLTLVLVMTAAQKDVVMGYAEGGVERLNHAVLVAAAMQLPWSKDAFQDTLPGYSSQEQFLWVMFRKIRKSF